MPKGCPGTRTDMLRAIHLRDRLFAEYKKLCGLKRSCKRTREVLYYARCSAAVIAGVWMREYYDDNSGHYPDESGIYPYPK